MNLVYLKDAQCYLYKSTTKILYIGGNIEIEPEIQMSTINRKRRRVLAINSRRSKTTA